MEKKVLKFRDLKVWRKGIELVKKVYDITKTMPRDEQYCLSTQMRRASISIPSNIAEGFRRKYIKEHKQFLRISLGSCAELETQLVIAKELGYIKELDEGDLMERIDHICRMIFNLKRRMQ